MTSLKTADPIGTDVSFRSSVTVTLMLQVGSDAMICAAAKVSTSPAEALDLARDREASTGLIRYLMRHRHGTPFEHGLMTFYVHAPIFVMREMQRHRIGMSFNEESGRYHTLEPSFWSPPADRPLNTPDDYKPARPTFDRGTAEQFDLIASHDQILFDAAYSAYEAEIANGIAREVARRLLPLATYSSAWVTCNPRSLMHFLSLRTHRTDAAHPSYPQREIEQVAEAMEVMFAQYWPITARLFDALGRVAP
ncbi:MAG: FAD-dependent thymidylate synthase [Thermomicrobiales bacterium]